MNGDVTGVREVARLDGHLVCERRPRFITDLAQDELWVKVESFNVDSPNQITADIRVTSAAEPGTRDIVLVTQDGQLALAGAFAVTEVPGLPLAIMVCLGLISSWVLLRSGLYLAARRRRTFED